MWRTRGALAVIAVLALTGGGLLFFDVFGSSTKSNPRGTIPLADATTGSTLPAIGDSCLVGTWRAQQTVTQTGITDPLLGGANTIEAVSADGGVVVDYSASADWFGFVDGSATSITKRGTERHHASGSLIGYQEFNGDVSAVFTTQHLVGAPPLVIRSFFQESTRNYTCTQTTLTVENPGSDPDIWARQG
jgi:hypothetical protein